MATIEKFEDIEAWKKARLLCSKIFSFAQASPFNRDFELKNQINAASGSIMDNIAEGFERGGRNEFVNFIGIAKGSAGEVKSQLYRALDRKYINENDFNDCYQILNEIGKMLNGLTKYLNQSDHKGTKFKNRNQL